ncbi:hypothetical protein KSX_65020 [Ktedonospora formicarum]|uniref:Uncharacterized protein n=1 Tax=Ktedonospora formicarum TaxID=2778364 RepID=A0A8J3IBJ5_9CHLR|nr:hypothetical protein KSX_65020 [Ktedonospora formicarum]
MRLSLNQIGIGTLLVLLLLLCVVLLGLFWAVTTLPMEHLFRALSDLQPSVVYPRTMIYPHGGPSVIYPHGMIYPLSVPSVFYPHS